jgi:hypothetical protein
MLCGYACACIGMMITAIGTSKTTFSYGAAATFGIFFFNFTLYLGPHPRTKTKDVLTLRNSGIGLQIPPWLYGVEITPLKLRYIAGAVTAASGKSHLGSPYTDRQLICGFTGWIWNYVVVQVTQPGIEGIGYKFFIIFAALNFCWFWVVYCKSEAELFWVKLLCADHAQSSTLRRNRRRSRSWTSSSRSREQSPHCFEILPPINKAVGRRFCLGTWRTLSLSE